MQIHFLDVTFLVIILGFSLYSLLTGFLKRVSGTIAALSALVVAYFGYKPVFELLKTYLSIHTRPFKYLVFALIFIVIFIIVRLLLRKLSDSINDTVIAGSINRLLGFILGLFQSGLIVLIVSFIIYFISDTFAKQSVIISYLITLF